MRGLPSVATLLVLGAASAWSLLFAWLAIVRHLAGGSHAEDLGFTDQVIWNFLRGQWFRMSVYQGATWNTEIDVAHVARPDSLLAFHVEPMLLGFVPLYALGAGPVVLLAVQALAVGLGAIPAYRLGQHYGRSQWAGVSVALAYLLSPLGQWAVLSDFHTSTLAAPLLLLAAERALVAARSGQGMLAAALALTAREDVGPAVALLGISLMLLGVPRRVGVRIALMGLLWTIAAAAVLIAYSGGVSPFGMRYAASIGHGILRPEALGALVTTLLSGAWLGLLSPAALLPAVPALSSNALSGSPWMAAGKAHYSGLILPFVILGAAAGFRPLRQHARAVAVALLVTSCVAYLAEGAGPLAANYAPATITAHARSPTALPVPGRPGCGVHLRRPACHIHADQSGRCLPAHSRPPGRRWLGSRSSRGRPVAFASRRRRAGAQQRRSARRLAARTLRPPPGRRSVPTSSIRAPAGPGRRDRCRWPPRHLAHNLAHERPAAARHTARIRDRSTG